MKQEDLRRIGLYAGRIAAVGGNMTVLSDAERRRLHDLLEKLMAELEESTSMKVPASWGDVRKR